MQFIKTLIFSLSIFSIFIIPSFALPVCKGENRTLTWSSTNCVANTFTGGETTNSGLCNFPPSANGTLPINDIQSGCRIRKRGQVMKKTGSGLALRQICHLFHNPADRSVMNIKPLRNLLHAVTARCKGLRNGRVSVGYCHKHS